MKVPLSWLKEWVDCELPVQEIENHLVGMGIEVDAILGYAEHIEGVIVAKVESVEPHPDAKRLNVAKVFDGSQSWQVVCGASNCKEGMLSVLAPIGTLLPGGFEIKKAKLRGVESYGMLCALSELGFDSDLKEIIDLDEAASPGENPFQYLVDPVFEVSLTPNLGHCFSVRGIARELAARLDVKAKKNKVQTAQVDIEQKMGLKIEAKEACADYACQLIEGIKIMPSPKWVQKRLGQVGVRPLNNVVDATNYVLMELGHPTHAFDAEKIKDQILVRMAKEGEKIETLDATQRTLKETHLLIADSEKPIAVAGVMGGSNSEVSDKTEKVLVEVAVFDPSAVRKSAKDLGLSTEASKRFERGIDGPEWEHALDRVVELIVAWHKEAGVSVKVGPVVHESGKTASKETPKKEIKLRLSKLNRLLGSSYTLGEVSSLLKRLEIEVIEEKEALIALPPTYRNDLNIEEDLVEEVMRLMGLEVLSRPSLRWTMSQANHDPSYIYETKLRKQLKGQGFREMMNTDLVSSSLLGKMGLDPKEIIKVLNPSSVELDALRPNLLLSALAVIKHNLDHGHKNLSLFEVGSVYLNTETKKVDEERVVSMILSGSSINSSCLAKAPVNDFYSMKGHLFAFLEAMGLESIEVVSAAMDLFHPGRQAKIQKDGLVIGRFGEVHPRVLRDLEVDQAVFYAELSIADLMEKKQKEHIYSPLPIYPGSQRDWTLTLGEEVSFKELTNAAPNLTLLKSIDLVDIWRSKERLGEGLKNVTLRFTYRDSQRTLSQEEVEKAHGEVKDQIEYRISEMKGVK